MSISTTKAFSSLGDQYLGTIAQPSIVIQNLFLAFSIFYPVREPRVILSIIRLSAVDVLLPVY